MVLKGYWPALAWSLIILLLTGLPGNVFPEIKTFWDWLSPDKVVHLIMFGTLSFLILFGYRHQYEGNNKQKLVWAAVLSAIAYGFFTEVLQYYVFIGRSGNIYDALADAIGAVFGWWLFIPVFKKLKSKTA
jgi:VanZ family protein